MRTPNFSTRLLLALSVVAPTVFLAHTASAQSVPFEPVNRTNFESPTLREPVEFSPNLDQKLRGVDGNLSPEDDSWTDSWSDSWGESIDDSQLQDFKQPTPPSFSPSAVDTFRSLDNPANKLR
ncbi:MAG: hypothetical protein SAL07_22250 [Oscillatoria sp. PMC 1051.18]|nr:hypothetical protein [Oscillatoria sp. PMC 1050.18]MEC5032632.1 hypothetical protein [Oscillatoria sp. PMC 1051.18]